MGQRGWRLGGRERGCFGLVAEADSPNVLVQKLRILIPELLELNGVLSDRTASFHLLYQHEESGVLTF